MSVRVNSAGTICLEGHCGVEDAEQLLIALSHCAGGLVDISRMTKAHLAVAQVLAAARPSLAGKSENAFVRDMLIPALRGSEEKDAGSNGVDL